MAICWSSWASVHHLHSWTATGGGDGAEGCSSSSDPAGAGCCGSGSRHVVPAAGSATSAGTSPSTNSLQNSLNFFPLRLTLAISLLFGNEGRGVHRRKLFPTTLSLLGHPVKWKSSPALRIVRNYMERRPPPPFVLCSSRRRKKEQAGYAYELWT